MPKKNKEKSHKEQEFLRLCLETNMKDPVDCAYRAGIINTKAGQKREDFLALFERLLSGLQVIDLFRKIGLNEVFIASNLKKLIEDESAPTNARVQALNIASKCLNLQKDITGGDTEIVITKLRKRSVKGGKVGRPKKKAPGSDDNKGGIHWY